MLKLLSALGLLTVTGPLSAGGKRSPACDHLALNQLFEQPDHALRLGQKLLSVNLAQPVDLDKLLADTGIQPAADRHHRLATLAARRKRDFAVGNTVEIDGWIVARSEAAICQLIALAAAQPC